MQALSDLTNSVCRLTFVLIILTAITQLDNQFEDLPTCHTTIYAMNMIVLENILNCWGFLSKVFVVGINLSGEHV